MTLKYEKVKCPLQCSYIDSLEYLPFTFMEVYVLTISGDGQIRKRKYKCENEEKPLIVMNESSKPGTKYLKQSKH